MLFHIIEAHSVIEPKTNLKIFLSDDLLVNKIISLANDEKREDLVRAFKKKYFVNF